MSAWLSELRTVAEPVPAARRVEPDRRPSSAGPARHARRCIHRQRQDRGRDRHHAAAARHRARARRPRLAAARRRQAAGRVGRLGEIERVPRRHGIHARDAAARRVHLVRTAARGPQLARSPPLNEQEESRRDLRAPQGPQPASDDRAGVQHAVRAAGRGRCCRRRRPTRASTSRRARCSSTRTRRRRSSSSASPACRSTSRRSACTTPRRRTSSSCAASCWSSTAARCPNRAKRSKRCPASGARPRT